jgi:hypothetical protein
MSFLRDKLLPAGLFLLTGAALLEFPVDSLRSSRRSGSDGEARPKCVSCGSDDLFRYGWGKGYLLCLQCGKTSSPTEDS